MECDLGCDGGGDQASASGDAVEAAPVPGKHVTNNAAGTVQHVSLFYSQRHVISLQML